MLFFQFKKVIFSSIRALIKNRTLMKFFSFSKFAEDLFPRHQQQHHHHRLTNMSFTFHSHLMSSTMPATLGGWKFNGEFFFDVQTSSNKRQKLCVSACTGYAQILTHCCATKRTKIHSEWKKKTEVTRGASHCLI